MAAETKTKTVRTIDPAIAELRAKHKQAVEQLQITRRSGEILKRIIEELIPKLTPTDKKTLLDHMAAHLKA